MPIPRGIGPLLRPAIEAEDSLLNRTISGPGQVAKNVGGSALAGLLGIPGDVEQLMRSASTGFSSGPVAQKHVSGNVLPSTGDIQGLLGVEKGRPESLLGEFGAPDPMDLYRAGGKGLLAMTLFHGTPHKFDMFDMSKIGTGEGAQAYGHGLYFAENPEVASQYKMALSPSDVLFDGRPVPNGSKLFATNGNFNVNGFVGAKPKEIAEQLGVSMEEASALSTLGSFDSIDEAIESSRRASKESWRGFDGQSSFRRQAEILEGMKDRISINPDGGHLYEVDIPDETVAKMLDWDAPLSEQPESVRTGLAELYEDMRTINKPSDPTEQRQFLAKAHWLDPESMHYERATGADIYESLTDLAGGDAAEASRVLNDNYGIPGIRYFDGSSRAAGEGTRNIVVFDPQSTINSVKRDGETVFNRIGK